MVLNVTVLSLPGGTAVHALDGHVELPAVSLYGLHFSGTTPAGVAGWCNSEWKHVPTRQQPHPAAMVQPSSHTQRALQPRPTQLDCRLRPSSGPAARPAARPAAVNHPPYWPSALAASSITQPISQSGPFWGWVGTRQKKKSCSPAQRGGAGRSRRVSSGPASKPFLGQPPWELACVRRRHAGHQST